MNNNTKIILDLCGGTGSWSKPYKDAGYDVKFITMPEYDVTKVIILSEVMLFYKADGGFSVIEYSNVYGILAAPPCTEFSLAKGGRPRDFANALQVVEACERIIRQCRLQGNPKFWAMENPRGFLRQFIGKPAFTFEQWEFGDNKRKATDIWGYFNEPQKTHGVMPDGMSIRIPNGRANGRDWAKCPCPPEYEYLNLDRAALRAITPPGFAQAFYKANN